MTNTKRSNVLLEELMGRVLRELNVQTLLKVAVTTDLYDSNKNILKVSLNKGYSIGHLSITISNSSLSPTNAKNRTFSTSIIWTPLNFGRLFSFRPTFCILRDFSSYLLILSYRGSF